MLPFPQLQSSQSVCRLSITDFPPRDTAIDMVDVELHAVLATTSALDTPEAIPAQHVITHRARDLRMFLVVGHTTVLILKAAFLPFFLLLGLAMLFYISIVKIVSAAQSTMAI